jgi:membrane protease YdiL (CAAX protease family)
MDLLPGCRRGAVPVPIFSGEAEKTDGGPGKEEINIMTQPAESAKKGHTDTMMPRSTAGDFEREAKSRLFNAVEALGMMVLILVTLWPFAYLFGILNGDNPTVHAIANGILVLGALYILFVSHRIHRDSLNSWGLGDPRVLWRMLRDGPPGRRMAVWAVVLFLFSGLNYANYRLWPDVVDFLNLDKTGLVHYHERFPQVLLVFAFGVPVSLLIISCAIRYDNFLSAFRTAMIIALPLLAVMLLAAWLQRGASVFARFSLRDWTLDVFGYVFWGFIQQLLFSSYFGTRFRKAFAPSAAPDNVTQPGKRWPKVLGAGITGAAGTAFFAFAAVSLLHGPGSIDAATLLLIAVLIFPLGMIYGWFWCRDRKRLIVATLAASCFGLIHIDSYGLVVVTWGLGIVLVYVFMEDRNRNLVALGFIHGILGSSFGELFSRGESGVLEIDYSVGPWNVDNPGAAALIIPMICIAAFLGILAWAVQNIRE